MTLTNDELEQRLREIKLLICDVDGVLTDGGIFLGHEEEYKRYDSRDGSGLKYLMRSGVQVALLTGRRSQSVERRAAELGISLVRQRALKKLPVFVELLEEAGVTARQAAYVGDDLVDLPPMRAAGLGVAVADAAADVREYADLVTEREGGHAAVRELIELIMKAQGKWAAVVDSYLEQEPA
ncbi:KdsC family phosphatase [Candidatus Sumerlaeota bacterium]